MLQTISTKEPTTNLHPASSDINITENTRAAYPFCRLLSFLFLLFRHMVRMRFRCSSKLAQLKQWEINKVVFTIFCGLINSEALHFGRKRCNICNSFSWTRIFKLSLQTIELQTKESRPSREVKYMQPNTRVISTYSSFYMAFYDYNTRNTWYELHEIHHGTKGLW